MNLQELKQRSHGCYIVIPTPFQKNGDVDYGGLRANTRWLVDQLVGKEVVLSPLGSSSEAYALSEEETRQVMKTVVEAVDGKLPVVAGAARAGTRETVGMCQYAESVGADGVMVVLPYYHVPTEEGMYQHYKQVAGSLKIGVMVYNNSPVSGAWINPMLMSRLAEIDNIYANKENSVTIQQQYAMLKGVDPKRMTTICGIGELIFAYLSLVGSPGFVSQGFANFAPLLSYGFWEAAKENDYTRMKQLIATIEPLSDFRARVDAARPHCGTHATPYGGGYMYISIVKQGMNLLGLCGGYVRLPLVDITEAQTRELKRIMQGMGLRPA